MQTEREAREVLQCDRDAAAVFGRSVSRLSSRDAENVRAGSWDATQDVQAFARHRETAEAAAYERAAQVNDDAADRIENGPGKLSRADEMVIHILRRRAAAIRTLSKGNSNVG